MWQWYGLYMRPGRMVVPPWFGSKPLFESILFRVALKFPITRYTLGRSEDFAFCYEQSWRQKWVWALEEWCLQEKTDVRGEEPLNTTSLTTKPTWKWYGLASGKPRLEVGVQPCGPWHGIWGLKKTTFLSNDFQFFDSTFICLMVPSFRPIVFLKIIVPKPKWVWSRLSDTDKGLFR